MIFAMEQADPGRHAVHPQGGEHLQGVGHPAAVVLVRLDKEGRRLALVGIFERRAVPHLLRAVPRVGLHRAQIVVVADVGGQALADKVGDGALGGHRGKAVGVADHPVGHKAAVAAAGHADSGRVDLRIFCQHHVGELHQVVVVQHAVARATDVGKFVALAVAAARVTEKDKVALVGPKLHLVEKDFAVDRLRPAVDIQNGRIGLVRVVVHRLDDPAIDLDAVAVGEGKAVQRADRVGAQKFAVQVGELVLFALPFLAGVDLLQAVVPHGDVEKLPIKAVKAVDAAVLVGRNDRLGPLLQVQADDAGIKAAGLAVVPGAVDSFLADAAAVTAIRTDAGAHARVEVAELIQLAGLRVGGEEGRVLVGAVSLAGRGRDDDLLSGKGSSVHPIAVLQIDLNVALAVQLAQIHVVLLVVHPLIVMAVVEDGIGRLVVVKVGDVHKRRAEQLAFPALAVKQIEPVAQLVDDPFAVGPEWQLVEHLIVLFFLNLFDGLLARVVLQPV